MSIEIAGPTEFVSLVFPALSLITVSTSKLRDQLFICTVLGIRIQQIGLCQNLHGNKSNDTFVNGF